jgi:hypothetical protein
MRFQTNILNLEASKRLAAGTARRFNYRYRLVDPNLEAAGTARL